MPVALNDRPSLMILSVPRVYERRLGQELLVYTTLQENLPLWKHILDVKCTVACTTMREAEHLRHTRVFEPDPAKAGSQLSTSHYRCACSQQIYCLVCCRNTSLFPFLFLQSFSGETRRCLSLPQHTYILLPMTSGFLAHLR